MRIIFFVIYLIGSIQLTFVLEGYPVEFSLAPMKVSVREYHGPFFLICLLYNIHGCNIFCSYFRN